MRLSSHQELLDHAVQTRAPLIAAGHQVAVTAFPIVARCDMFWPQHDEANTNQQYIHLNDTLIAPSGTRSRMTHGKCGSHRHVDGRVVGGDGDGSEESECHQPYEKIPMWHKRVVWCDH